MKYNKLIRDHIPAIIIAKGGQPKTHVASQEEYAIKLKEKLSEEVREYLQEGNIEELADVMEVVHALAELGGVDAKRIEEIRQAKAGERGGFTKHLILDES